MKKISKKDLNRRALTGARIVKLEKPEKPAPAAIPAAQTDQVTMSDFDRLAASLNEQLQAIYEQGAPHESTGVSLYVRRSNRLIKDIEGVKTLSDGSRKRFKCTFNRNHVGDVSSVSIVPVTD